MLGFFGYRGSGGDCRARYRSLEIWNRQMRLKAWKVFALVALVNSCLVRHIVMNPVGYALSGCNQAALHRSATHDVPEDALSVLQLRDAVLQELPLALRTGGLRGNGLHFGI